MSNLKTRVSMAAVAGSVLASMLFAASASASVILFDRGLPTANLNNAAGANRSNVAWADTDPATVSMGDNFSLAYADVIDTIRVWVVASGPAPSAGAFTLWIGPDAFAASFVAATASSSSVTLANYASIPEPTYQGTSGAYLNMYQVDFAGLNLALGAGTYAFGVSGPASAGCPTCVTPFVHASNALLSGSPQMGSDGFIYGFDLAGNMVVGYPWPSSNGGWDKNSDLNVQVFSTPEPSSVALIAVALFSLLGLGLMRRRQNT